MCCCCSWLHPSSPSPRLGPSARATLRDPSHARAAATSLGIVVTNRATPAVPFTFRVSVAGVPSSAPAITLAGYAFAYNSTNVALGSVTATQNTTTGLWDLALPPVPTNTIHFWVQES
jgi:hypothetical protein